MYIKKSMECESGNHEACCQEHSDFDDCMYWSCDCNCHRKNNTDRNHLSCPNCGSTSIESYSEDYDSADTISLIFTCNDCLSKTATIVASDYREDVPDVCTCSGNDIFIDEYDYYCPSCGGLLPNEITE